MFVVSMASTLGLVLTLFAPFSRADLNDVSNELVRERIGELPTTESDWRCIFEETSVNGEARYKDVDALSEILAAVILRDEKALAIGTEFVEWCLKDSRTSEIGIGVLAAACARLRMMDSPFVVGNDVQRRLEGFLASDLLFHNAQECLRELRRLRGEAVGAASDAPGEIEADSWRFVADFDWGTWSATGEPLTERQATERAKNGERYFVEYFKFENSQGGECLQRLYRVDEKLGMSVLQSRRK